MEAVISTVSAPQPTPNVQPDVRPTADAAAIARDTNPNLPMAIPASMAQSGAVNAARMADETGTISGAAPTERVLKPYGVAMLPETPNSPAQSDETAADTDQVETAS